jgi:hypothetical protein
MRDKVVESESESGFLKRWVSGLMHPVEPRGDYFVRLGSSVAASAPTACSSCI